MECIKLHCPKYSQKCTEPFQITNHWDPWKFFKISSHIQKGSEKFASCVGVSNPLPQTSPPPPPTDPTDLPSPSPSDLPSPSPPPQTSPPPPHPTDIPLPVFTSQWQVSYEELEEAQTCQVLLDCCFSTSLHFKTNIRSINSCHNWRVLGCCKNGLVY